MKKYFMTMVVMAIFAIGFAASDEESSSSSSSDTYKVEQQHEPEAERLKNKQNEIAEAAYNNGYQHGFEGRSDIIGDPKTISYTTRYGAPKSDEEKKCLIYGKIIGKKVMMMVKVPDRVIKTI